MGCVRRPPRGLWGESRRVARHLPLRGTLGDRRPILRVRGRRARAEVQSTSSTGRLRSICLKPPRPIAQTRHALPRIARIRTHEFRFFTGENLGMAKIVVEVADEAMPWLLALASVRGVEVPDLVATGFSTSGSARPDGSAGDAHQRAVGHVPLPPVLGAQRKARKC